MRLYCQWIKDDKPLVTSDYVDRVLYADMDAMAHLNWLDAALEDERNNNPLTEAEIRALMDGKYE